MEVLGWNSVPQSGLKLFIGNTGSGASQEVQAKITCHWHELKSDLQMAATCAGLGGTQERLNHEPQLAATIARPGVT